MKATWWSKPIDDPRITRFKKEFGDRLPKYCPHTGAQLTWRIQIENRVCGEYDHFDTDTGKPVGAQLREVVCARTVHRYVSLPVMEYTYDEDNNHLISSMYYAGGGTLHFPPAGKRRYCLTDRKWIND